MHQKVAHAELKPLPLDWINITFLALVTGGAILSTACYALGAWQANPYTIELAWWMFFLSGLSITVGYHRGISHNAFACAPILRFLFLVFGAASFVGSLLTWARNHRDHHADPEGPRDRYARGVGLRGFWWSHMGAVCHKDPNPNDYGPVPDLRKDRMTMIQDKYFVLLSFIVAILAPCTIAGIFWGDALGALWICFFVRVGVQLQLIFSVNSFAHTFGKHTFSKGQSACDNVVANAVLTMALLACLGLWVVGYSELGATGIKVTFALATCGEILGHGYHHAFPGDYRNYPRWWYLDPSRWVIHVLAWLRLIKRESLHPPSEKQIETALRAR